MGWRESILLKGAACFEEESWDAKVWIRKSSEQEEMALSYGCGSCPIGIGLPSRRAG